MRNYEKVNILCITYEKQDIMESLTTLLNSVAQFNHTRINNLCYHAVIKRFRDKVLEKQKQDKITGKE